MNEADEMVGLNPHFEGTAVSVVRLVEKVEDPAAIDLDGRIYCEAEPGEDGESAYLLLLICRIWLVMN